MTKTDLITNVATKLNVSKKDVREITTAVFDEIVEIMKNGEKLQLTGFGTFEAVERAAKKGTNPQTGEAIIIPAKHVPKIKFSNTLKNAFD